jgi:hypothetical protein
VAALSPTTEVVVAVGIAVVVLLGPVALIFVLMRGERAAPYVAVGYFAVACLALYLQWRELVDH